MARQTGLIKLKGSIGNVTFYTTVAGDLARQKGGIDPERLATDPTVQRTWENRFEFGCAGRLLYTAFRGLIAESTDSYMYSQLVREFVKVIKADPTRAAGKGRS